MGNAAANEFADCDVLICFGTPNPNPQELERQAEALYWDQEAVNPQTLLEPRVFEQSGGQVLQTRVRAYRDPRLHEMHRAKREEELLQAIFRARPHRFCKALNEGDWHVGLLQVYPEHG